MEHPIARLISEGEHQRLDFKFEIGDAPKIARTLSAFANTLGGRLLVGVKDNGAIAGVRSDEEIFMVESAAGLYCRPPVPFTVKEWEINRKTVLEVIIPRSPDRPHYARQKEGNWVAYHRVGDQNFEVNRILHLVWKLEKKPEGVTLRFQEPEKQFLDHLAESGSITLSKFVRLAAIPRRKAESILARFVLLNVVDMHFSENSTFFTLKPSGPHPPGNPEP